MVQLLGNPSCTGYYGLPGNLVTGYHPLHETAYKLYQLQIPQEKTWDALKWCKVAFITVLGCGQCTGYTLAHFSFFKKIRGTRQTANYLYIFHSSPKYLPKVRSRELDYSDKCFFHVIFHVVLQNKCRKNGYFRNPRLFLLIANICGTYQGILNFKTSRNISLE